MEMMKKYWYLIPLLIILFILFRKRKRKATSGILLSKKVRRINRKLRRKIPLSEMEKEFRAKYSHAKNNPKGKVYRFLKTA